MANKENEKSLTADSRSLSISYSMPIEILFKMAETFFAAYEPQTVQKVLKIKDSNKWKQSTKNLNLLKKIKHGLIPRLSNVNIILNP